MNLKASSKMLFSTWVEETCDLARTPDYDVFVKTELDKVEVDYLIVRNCMLSTGGRHVTLK